VRIGVIGQKKNHEDGSQNDPGYGQLVGEIHGLFELFNLWMDLICIFDSSFHSSSL
jgi:hypothetical protein